MARETFSITFICRETKKDVFGLSPIMMTIIINGQRTQIQLPRKAEPAVFKSGKDPDITEYCLEQRKRVDRALTKMLKDEVELTSANLKEYLKNNTGCQKIYTLRILFDEYIELLKKRLNRDLTKDTYNRYVKTTQMFLEYNGIPDSSPAKDITFEHLLKYQTALNEKLDPATSCNYLQKIKTIFKYAFETGKIPSNPAFGLKINKGTKNTILYLTEEELQKIENHSFGKRLQEIADVFLFSCYTGLSFADIATLEKGDFKTNNLGYTYVEKARTKTGVIFTAILLGKSEEILRKYNYRLPVKSNQRTNEYLKEIQDICEIDKPLHFHMARHTAASLLINHRPEIPNETIQRIMGWTDERQLKHYASIFNQTVFDDIHKAFGLPKLAVLGDDRPKVEGTPPSKGKKAKLSPDMDDFEYIRELFGLDEENSDGE